MTATITNAAQGLITLSLTGSETSGIEAAALHTSRWVYDVTITSSDSIVTRVFEGNVIMNSILSPQRPATILLP